MKQNAIYPKVALDMFVVQLTWALGFLGVMLLVHIGKIIASTFGDYEVDSYFNVVFIAANIFMFVVGILCVNFLPHYVSNGVTRKDYFKGALIGALGLSVALPVIASIGSLLSKVILNLFEKITIKEADINSVITDIETDSNIIGNIVDSVVQSFIVPPYIDPTSNFVLAIAIVSLNIFIYFLVGWLIGVAFYRLGTLGGLLFIVIGLALIIVKDALLRLILNLPLPPKLAFIESLSNSIGGIIIVAIILLALFGIRSLSKNMTVKL
ncbi:hypothetical protein [Ornithinibacillus halotolerans]|uniref:Uncharacterized protein n=1 Tax=Ornithinibacillus halotolerans TaxID=1274357 RepID=A0A916S046_9BACI|nr:hypothetical protein [Ornithinibacillus halotolerans]GGA74928.1 hypothetical protein GCM10008025_18300 [Ornithinibacillus halotolerans]